MGVKRSVEQSPGVGESAYVKDVMGDVRRLFSSVVRTGGPIPSVECVRRLVRSGYGRVTMHVGQYFHVLVSWFCLRQYEWTLVPECLTSPPASDGELGGFELRRPKGELCLRTWW